MRCGVVRLVTRKSPCDIKIKRKGWSSSTKYGDSSVLCEVAESKLIGRCCAHKICRVVDRSSKVFYNTLSTSNGSKKKTVLSKTPLINRLDHLNNFNSDLVWTDYNLYNEKLNNSTIDNSVSQHLSSQHSRTTKTIRNKKKCVFYSSENPVKPCQTRFKLPHSSTRYHTLRKLESLSHQSSCDRNFPTRRSYLDRFEAVKRKKLYPIVTPLARHLQNSDFHSFIDDCEMETTREGECTGDLINPNIMNHLNETSYMSLCGCDACDKKLKAHERKSRINKFINKKMSKILNFYRMKNHKTKSFFQDRSKYETDLKNITNQSFDSTETHSRPIYEPSIDQKKCGRYRQITEFRDNYKPLRKRISKNRFNYYRSPTSNFGEKRETNNSRDKIGKNNSEREVNIGSKIYSGLKTCGELLSFGKASKSETESKAIQTKALYSDHPQDNNQLLKNNVYDLSRKYRYRSKEDNIGDQFDNSLIGSYKYTDTKHSKHDIPCDNSVHCSLSEEFKSRHNLSNSSQEHSEAVFNTENEKCYELLSHNIASSYNSMFDRDLVTNSNYSKSYENRRPYGPLKNNKPFSEGSVQKFKNYSEKDEINGNSSSYFDDCTYDLKHNLLNRYSSVDDFNHNNLNEPPSAQKSARNDNNFPDNYNRTKVNTDVSLKSFDSQNIENQAQYGPLDSMLNFIANNDVRYKEKEDLVKLSSNFSIFPRSAWRDSLLLPESDLLSESVDVSKPYYRSGYHVKKDESKNLSRYSEINIAIQKVRKKIENIIHDSNETKSIFVDEWCDNFHNNLNSERLISNNSFNHYYKNIEQTTIPGENNAEYNHATNHCNNQEENNIENSNGLKLKTDHDSDLMHTNVTNHQFEEAVQDERPGEDQEKNLDQKQNEGRDHKDHFDDCKCIYQNDQHIASSVHLNDIIKNIKESNENEIISMNDSRSEIKIAPHVSGYRVYDQHQPLNQVRKVRFKDNGLSFKPGTERLMFLGRDTLFNQTCKRSMSTFSSETIEPIDKENNGNNKLLKEDHQDGSVYQNDIEKSANLNQKNITKKKSFVSYVRRNTNRIYGENVKEQINTESLNIEHTSYQEGCQDDLYNRSLQAFAKTNNEKSVFGRTEYDSTEKNNVARNLTCDCGYFKRACNESRDLKYQSENNNTCNKKIYSIESKNMSHTNEWANKTLSSTQDMKVPVNESIGVKSSRSKSAYGEVEYEQNACNSSRENIQDFYADHSGCINVGYLGLKFAAFSNENWNEVESSESTITEKFNKEERTKVHYNPNRKMNNMRSLNSPIFRNSKLHLQESRTLDMRNKNEMTVDTINIRNPFSGDSGAIRPVSSTCTLSKDDNPISKVLEDKTALARRLRNIKKIEKVDYAIEEKRLANNTPIDTVKVKETYLSPDTSLSHQESQGSSNLKTCFKEYERQIKNKPTSDSEDTRQISEEMKVVGLFPEGKGTIKGRVMTVIAKQRSKFTSLKSHENSIETTLENSNVTGEILDSKTLKPIVESRPLQKGFVKAILSSPKLSEVSRDKKKILNDQGSTLNEEDTNEQEINKIQKQKTYKKYEGMAEKDNYLVELKKVKPNKLENTESVSPRSKILKKPVQKNMVFGKVESHHENKVNKEDETPYQDQGKHIKHLDKIDKNARVHNSVPLINREDDIRNLKVNDNNKQSMRSKNKKNETLAEETHEKQDDSKEGEMKIKDTKESRMLKTTDIEKNVQEENTPSDKYTVTMRTLTDFKTQEPKSKEGIKNVPPELDLNIQKFLFDNTYTKKTFDSNEVAKSIKDQSDNDAIIVKTTLETDSSKKEIKSEPEEFGKKSSLQDFEEYKESWLNKEKDETKNLTNDKEDNKRSRLIKFGRKYGHSFTSNQDESKLSPIQTSFDQIIAEHRTKLKNAEKSDNTSITNYLESNNTDVLEKDKESSNQSDIGKSSAPMADNMLVITHFKQMYGPNYDESKSLNLGRRNFEFEASMLKVTYEGKNNETNGESFDALSDDVEKELNEIVSPYMEEFKLRETSLLRKKKSQYDKMKPKEYYLSLSENKSFVSSRERVTSTENETDVGIKDGLREEEDKNVKSFIKNRMKLTEAKYKSYLNKSKELSLGDNVSKLVPNSFKKLLDKHEQEDRDSNYKKEINPDDPPQEETSLKPQAESSNEEKTKAIQSKTFFKKSIDKAYPKSLYFGKIESIVKPSKAHLDKHIKEDKTEISGIDQDKLIQSSSQKIEKPNEEVIKSLTKKKKDKETTMAFDKIGQIKKSVKNVKDLLISDIDKSRKDETEGESSKEEIVTETPKLEESSEITNLKAQDINSASTIESSRTNENTSAVTKKSTKENNLVPDRKVNKQSLLEKDGKLKWDDKEVTTVKETIDDLLHDESLKTSDNNLAKQHKTEIKPHMKIKKTEVTDKSREQNILGRDEKLRWHAKQDINEEVTTDEKSPPKTVEIESSPLKDESKGIEETTISNIEKSLTDEEMKTRSMSIDEEKLDIRTLIKSEDSLGPTPKQIIEEQDEKTSIAPEEEKSAAAAELQPEVNAETSKLLQVVNMKPQVDKEMTAWEKEPTYIKNLRPKFYEKKKIEKITNNYYQNELKFQTLMVKNKIVSASKTSDCKNVNCRKEKATWVADMCCSLDKKDKMAIAKNTKDDVVPKDTSKSRSPDRVPPFRSGRSRRMAEWPDSLSRRREPVIKDPFSPRPRWRP